MPGNFEARTGSPFVSYTVLAGSICAYKCREYEKCYNPSSLYPCQPCKPVPLTAGKGLGFSDEQIIQIRTERANDKAFPIGTVAGILDEVLVKAGLWRESWNGRQELRHTVSENNKPRPGSVYVCNTVKCRSCRPNDKGRLEDITPSVEEMAACSPFLQAQIYIIEPAVIVAIGNPATSALTGMREPKCLKNRGMCFPGKYKVPVLCEIHPSWISRQEDKEVRDEAIKHFVETLLQAKEIAAGTFTPTFMKKYDIIEGSKEGLDGMTFVNTFPSEYE